MTDAPLRDLLGDSKTVADADLVEDDEEFAPVLTQRRVSRLTVLLGVGVVAALAFTGGVLVQKHHDKSITSSAAAGIPAGLTGAGAFPALGSGAPSGLAAGGGSGATGGSTGPVVVGTIVSVSGDTLVVKDLGGTKHTVTLDSDTAVTRSSNAKHLHRGDTVSVNGTQSSDGDVTATAVTSR